MFRGSITLFSGSQALFKGLRKAGLLPAVIRGSAVVDRAKADGMGLWGECPVFGIKRRGIIVMVQRQVFR